MNNYFNFKIPLFIEKYGSDWTGFTTVVDDNVDYVMNRTFQLYWLNDIDYMNIRAVEKLLLALKITFTATETLREKKYKLRKFLTSFAEKGTEGAYLDYQESIVGTRGVIYSGYYIGTRRWGTSRWGDPADHQGDDIRWTMSAARFVILIDAKTSNSSLLDQLMNYYRLPYIKPAFYQIYIIDSSFNILRTI